MQKIVFIWATFATIWLGSVVAQGASTEADIAPHHSSQTLYVARLVGNAAVPPYDTSARGTATFVRSQDDEEAVLSYRITYDGLVQGSAQSILVGNFGEGQKGETVHIVCGPSAASCKDGAGGTLTGEWRGLRSELIRELTAGRLYVALVGRDGATELRGQLVTSPFMIHADSYSAELSAASGDGAASGTVAVFNVRLSDGRDILAYDLTVTGTTSEVTGASIVRASEGLLPTGIVAGGVTLQELPLDDRYRSSASGGGFSGVIEQRGSPGELIQSASIKAAMTPERDEKVFLVIATEEHPEGELIGALDPLP